MMLSRDLRPVTLREFEQDRTNGPCPPGVSPFVVHAQAERQQADAQAIAGGPIKIVNELVRARSRAVRFELPRKPGSFR